MNVNPLIASLETMSREGAELEEVLEAAVAGLHELNPRFHWTGIYELFPDGVLRLGPFVGAWVGTWYLAAWWAMPRMVGRPTLTRLVSSEPSGSFLMKAMTLAPGFNSDLSAGT